MKRVIRGELEGEKEYKDGYHGVGMDSAVQVVLMSRRRGLVGVSFSIDPLECKQV